MSSEEIEIEKQTRKLREKIERVTTLFSKGEITEESYKIAVKKIEKDIEDLRSGRKVSVTEEKEEMSLKIKRPEDFSYAHYAEPTKLWYLLPLFFGLLGGIIAYVAVKNDDVEMGDILLMEGFFITIIEALIILTFLP